MPTLFKKHSKQEVTSSLAAYLPGGPVFEAAHTPETNLRLFLQGLSLLLGDVEEKLNLVSSEYDIKTTTLFIEEWEGFVGIPDDCFSGTGTQAERRTAVLTKLTSLGIQTAQDYVDLASTFGVEVVVLPGQAQGLFPMTFPFILFDSEKAARFTIIINFTVQAANQFTLTFPIVFGTSEIATLECLFRKLRPANCDIIFNQI